MIFRLWHLFEVSLFCSVGFTHLYFLSLSGRISFNVPAQIFNRRPGLYNALLPHTFPARFQGEFAPSMATFSLPSVLSLLAGVNGLAWGFGVLFAAAGGRRTRCTVPEFLPGPGRPPGGRGSSGAMGEQRRGSVSRWRRAGLLRNSMFLPLSCLLGPQRKAV